MAYSAWAPLAGWADVVVLLVRLVMGSVMVYYGWPKVKNPRRNAGEIEKGGFAPGWLWGTIILLVEFVGGLAIIVGVYTWLAAALFGIEMLTGAVFKIIKAHKPFSEWSYDLLLLALALVLLAVGPGAYAVG